MGSHDGLRIWEATKVCKWKDTLETWYGFWAKKWEAIKA